MALTHGKPLAVFKDTVMQDRRTRQRAVLLSTTYDVLLCDVDDEMSDHKLNDWLAAEAEMICLMLRLRDRC